MNLFKKRRRKNKWLKDVIEHETKTNTDKLDESVAGDIVFRESSVLKYPDTEFGADINPGVTENAPYHDTSEYRMVGGYDEDNSGTVVNTQSS